ncbi:MAG: hypothetical protein K2J41_03470 [Eubacterium sp.]|nr:hypothetical protein [Eubacterium sp.]
MNKVMYLINYILLIINALLGVWFTFYTILGSYPFGGYITADDIEIQLIAALIFEFVFFTISKIISLKLKVDLSFKGKEIFSFVPKAVVISALIIATTLIAYSFVIKINIEFAIMIIVMAFSILLEIGITRMYKTEID